MPIGSRRDFDIGSQDQPVSPVSEKKESSWRRGFRRMDTTDAFEINDEALAELARANELLDEDRRDLRIRVAILVVIFAVLFFFSLGVSVSWHDYYSPIEVLRCLGLGIQMLFNNIFTTELPLNTVEVMAIEPHYYEVITRLSTSVLTALCGVFLALSGMLYQNVFRNPIAAPTMLGVSNGVNIGILVLVIVFGSSAIYMTGERYVLCYAGAFLVLALVLIGGRIIGGAGTFNVVNMLLIGSIVSQLIGTVTTFVSYLFMDDALYEIYYEVQEQLNVDNSIVSWIALFAVGAATILPIFFLRFSLNSLSFTDEDSRLLGVNTTRLRVISLVCGSIMMTASMIYSGMVSMISLLVPHLSRLIFGSEFRRQFIGNILVGAVLLLLCRDICDMIPFLDTGIPIGTVVSFVTLPLFVWMMAVQQRSWE